MRGDNWGFGRDRSSKVSDMQRAYVVLVTVDFKSYCTCTYLLRGNKSHSCNDPASLAGTKSKGLLDTEGIQHLDSHDGSVPVGVVL